MRETIIVSTADLYSSTMNSLICCLLMEKHKKENSYSFSWSIKGSVEVIQYSTTNISRHSDSVERMQECLKFEIDYEINKG